MCGHVSYVDVAQGATGGAHDILVLDRLGQAAHVDGVGELSGWAAGRVERRGAAGEGGLAVLEVHVLPHPPGAVDLGVVQEEGGLGGRGEEVTARVAAGGEVTAGVDTVEAGGEVALHAVLEGSDVVVVGDQVVHVRVLGPVGRDPGGDVAAEAARVVGERVGVRVVDDPRDGERGGHGTKVDRVVLERPGVDAAAARSGRDAVEAGGQGLGAVVRRVLAVAGHAVVRAVEERAVDGVEGVLAPVPVRLVTGVAAFVPQGLLERPGEVSVPREEVCRSVDGQGLVDVDSHKVVVA